MYFVDNKECMSDTSTLFMIQHVLAIQKPIVCTFLDFCNPYIHVITLFPFMVAIETVDILLSKNQVLATVNLLQLQ